jgi:hypothetical protein
MFIKYVHFVSEDNDITLSGHRSPPRLVVPIKLRSVLLDDQGDDALPFYRPVLPCRDDQVARPE